MSKLNVVVASLIVIGLMTGCGGSGSGNGQKQSETSTVSQKQEISDTQFKAILQEIYYKLPDTAMPDYLKTEQQRRDANAFNDEVETVNCANAYNFLEDGYEKWNMAAYLTADNKNVILIVQYGFGLDGFMMRSDQTFNYNIETGILTDIERPMDPFTVEELIENTHFESEALFAKAKAYYMKHKHVVYLDFDREGFMVAANLLDYDNSDYYGEQNRVISSRKWNGSRFVKGEKSYSNE